jgi:hypothetical protein
MRSMRLTSSSLRKWATTSFECCTPGSVSSWKISIPPGSDGPWRTALLTVLMLIPIFDKNVGRYFAWIFEHCCFVRHVVPRGYCIIICHMALKPMLMYSRPSGAACIHCFIFDAWWSRYVYSSSLSLPSGASRGSMPRVRCPVSVLIHCMVAWLSTHSSSATLNHCNRWDHPVVAC